MIYLASQSPRRQELLQQIGISYITLQVDVDESYHSQESPLDYVLRMASEKADAGRRLVNEQSGIIYPVLGADTIVVLNGKVLGKPKDKNNALEILSLLSGQTHQVFTAVAICWTGQVHAAVSESQVRFRVLSLTECNAYWETGEPRDKAGAYAIQGRGALFIEHLAGSYSGVMGLPLFETGQLLDAIAYASRQRDQE